MENKGSVHKYPNSWIVFSRKTQASWIHSCSEWQEVLKPNAPKTYHPNNALPASTRPYTSLVSALLNPNVSYSSALEVQRAGGPHSCHRALLFSTEISAAPTSETVLDRTLLCYERSSAPSILLRCPLFHYRNRALHTKIKSDEVSMFFHPLFQML